MNANPLFLVLLNIDSSILTTVPNFSKRGRISSAVLEKGTFWAIILVLEPSSSSSSSITSSGLVSNSISVVGAENRDRKGLGLREVERERERRGGERVVEEKIDWRFLGARKKDWWVEKWREGGRERR